ncbi:MAG: hypothetical protein AAF388_15500, partial [Bacteroidota bacterium]
MDVHVGWKYALGSAAFISLFLYLLVAVWINPLLEETARKSISLALGDKYELNSIDVSLQLWNQDLKIQDAIISLDSSANEQISLSDTLEENRFEIEIPFFEIKDLDYQKLFQEKELHIGKVILEKPTIKWWDVNSPDSVVIVNDSSSNINLSALAADADLFPLISQQLNSLRIDEVLFQNGELSYYQPIGEGQNQIIADDFSLQIENLLIDSTSHQVSQKAFLADEVKLEISLKDSRWVLPDSSYQIDVGSFGISTPEQLIYAQNVSFQPLHLPDSSHPATTLNINIPRIGLEGVDLEEILTGETLEINHLKLQQPSITLYKGLKTTTSENLQLPNLYKLIV